MENLFEFQRKPELVSEYEQRTERFHNDKRLAFIQALWNTFADVPYNPFNGFRWDTPFKQWNYPFAPLNKAFKELCGYAPVDCEEFGDFFCPTISSALDTYFGEKDARRIYEECEIAMELPFNHCDGSPIYLSSRAGDHTDSFFMIILNAIDSACYGLSIEELLTAKKACNSGVSLRAALALRRGDPKICSIVKEAVFRVIEDHNSVMLNRRMIAAITCSGLPYYLELLGKLIHTAKNQETPLRAVLEACTNGHLASRLYFLRFLQENNLCHIRSIARIVNSWVGPVFSEKKHTLTNENILHVLSFLTCEGFGGNPNPNGATDIYLTLWARCCHDVHSGMDSVRVLINDSDQ